MKKQIADVCDCCKVKVEALVSVDERGQMVLPKEVRDKIGLKTHEKLAVVSCDGISKCGCLVLLKAQDLEKTIKDVLGPMMKEIFKK